LDLPKQAASITSVAYSPDGDRLFTASGESFGDNPSEQPQTDVARVWDARTGKLKAEFLGHKGAVMVISVSPNGERVVTGSRDGSARYWDASTGQLIRQLDGHTGYVSSAKFTKDGRRVVTGGGDYTVIVWDLDTGNALLRLRGHGASVLSVALSPDNRLIATGSRDKAVGIWDITTGKLLLPFGGHQGYVNSVSFVENGRRVVSGANDGIVFVWDLPEIIGADVGLQVELACQKLQRVNAPLALKVADIATYPMLEGWDVDPDHPELLASPCRGVLPEEAFDPATAGDAWVRVYRDESVAQ